MRGFEFGGELLGVAPFSLPGLLDALSDTFTSVGAGRAVEQTLIGLHGLYDQFQVSHDFPIRLCGTPTPA